MILHDLFESPTDDQTAFRKWFGNSKVVDRNGSPLVVYHGSPDVRNILQQGFRASPHRGDVYFFTNDFAVANSYADDRRAFDYQNAEPHVLPVYLSMQNPLIVDGKGRRWRDTEHFVNLAKEHGHDGVIITNSRDEYNAIGDKGRLSTVYAVFSPRQIRSALKTNLWSRIDKKDLGTMVDPTQPSDSP